MVGAPIAFNANGSLVAASSVISFLTAPSPSGFAAGNKVLYKNGVGGVDPFDGTDSNAHDIVGVSDGTLVAPTGTATYMPVNGSLSSLSPAFAVGTVELYAQNDGTLCVYSALISGNYSRRIGSIVNSTQFQLDFGPVFQVP